MDHDITRGDGNSVRRQERGHIGAIRIETADDTKDATDDKPSSRRFLEPGKSAGERHADFP